MTKLICNEYRMALLKKLRDVKKMRYVFKCDT